MNNVPVQRLARINLAAVILLLLISACTKIPQKDLGLYRDAYGQARGATEQVLTGLIAARENILAFEAEKAAAAAQPDPGRGDYVPPVDRPGGRNGDAIGARLAALAIVGQYNDILAAIAEGKRVDTLQAKVEGAVEMSNRLLSLAGTSFPGVGAFTGLLQTVAATAQQYQDRRLFAEAIKQGAPLIKEILQFLIDETPKIVEIHEGVWDAQGARLYGQPYRVARMILSKAKN